MSGKEKAKPSKKRSHDLSQFGSTETPVDIDPSGEADYSGKEAEPSAMVNGDTNQKTDNKPKPSLIPASELDKMITESMRDIGSDEELSGDDDDAELLAELRSITGGESKLESLSNRAEVQGQQTILSTTAIDTISIIKTRLEMYKLAEAAATSSGESAKARRFNRGLKTLNDLLEQSVAGNTINVDEIPLEVSVKASKPTEEPSSDT